MGKKRKQAPILEKPEAESRPRVKRMSGQEIAARVRELAEPLCAAEGMDLIHVEYQRETGGRILRLYLEKPDGVSLEDCAEVSRQLSDLLDIKLPTEEPYTLEVSSPGANRPVSRPQDFERFRGHRVKIRLGRPKNGQKNFTGFIAGYSDQKVWIAVGDETIGLDHAEITKARLVNHI